MIHCNFFFVISGTTIVVVALLICHASYCISVLKEVSHEFKSGDYDCPRFRSGDPIRIRNR